MQYRREIDGLRSIAVVPVILFHAGLTLFSGGYVGVDIFFVISGYLITSIIVEEVKQGKFSIVNFYERRARRILPALMVVVIISYILAHIFMPAELYVLFAQSAVAVSTFLSNVYFYLTSGYFAPAVDEMPLIHTWSLAVEEQYYVFFPVMVSVIWAIRKNWLVPAIVILAALSLITSEYLAAVKANDANFYLIFSRAWELFAGSLIALTPTNKLHFKNGVDDLLAGTGLLLIFIAIFEFDSDTPFPGIYAAVPVIGTMLIIAFAHQTTLVGRFLSNPISVWIGLLSYSLYLWHQPLFAFLRLKSVGEPDWKLFSVAIVLTFILAYLSWRFIENPFRNKKLFGKKKIFTYSIISMAAVFSLGMLGHLNKGFPGRFDVPSYSDSIKISPKRRECHTEGESYISPSEACKYYGDNTEWIVFGDSHVVEIAYAIAKELEQEDKGVLHLSFSACRPYTSLKTNIPGCSQWIDEVVNYIVNDSGAKNVLVGFRYSWHLFGDQLDEYPEVPNRSPRLDLVDANDLSDDEIRERYWQDLLGILDAISRSGKQVYVLYPIPELPMDIVKGAMPISIFENSKTMLDLERSTTIEYYNDRNAFILERLENISLSNGVDVFAVKPYEIFCKDGFCPAIRNGKSLYYDDDHVSISGAAEIAKSIFDRELSAAGLVNK